MEKDDKKLNSVAKELYDLISTQFGDLKLGDDSATVVTEPEYARFFDFTYGVEGSKLGKVSVSLDDRAISVIYKKNFVSDQSSNVKKSWYDFLRKIRKIANINRLTFDVRDIDKSNLTKRDYQVMSSEKFKGNAMTESKFYGTSMKSYLNIGEARLVIHHSQPVNQEVPGGRSQHIESLYVESNAGERFKYPIKHLNGAKAMARHVSEGGNPYDEFGNHIVSLSEELGKLGKFKRYMGRGGVMAESLAQYVDAVNERISEVRSRVEKLQRETFYKEAFETFEQTVLEEVPDDLAANWVEELTIRQFNEELKDVFPYIYRIVSEKSKPVMLGPEEVVAEADPCWKGYKQIGMKDKNGKEVPNCVPEETELDENDRYRSNKNFKVVDQDYNNFRIYVSQSKVVQNQFMAVAVSNASNREVEDSKSLSNKPDKAVEMVRQKLDARVANSKKVTGDATLDFNVAFTHDFMANDADDLGVDDIKKLYAKIIPGPALVIANMYEFGEMPELLSSDGFSRAGDRARGGANPLIGIKLSSKRVQLSELVANGRYILGKPTQDKDGHYVYPMKFDSIVVDKGDLLKFNVPAVTVGSSRNENSFEAQIEDYFESLMGQFGESALQEAGNSMFVRFVERGGSVTGTGKAGPSLYMIAGPGNTPSDVQYKDAQIKMSAHKGAYETVSRMVQKLFSKEYMLSIDTALLVEPDEKLLQKYPGLGEYYADARNGEIPKVKVVFATSKEKKSGDDKAGIIKSKKKTPTNWASTTAKVEPPRQDRTYYVSLENPKMMDYLHRTKQEFMQKYWRPNIKRFVLNKKQLDNLKAFVNSPKNIEKFGNSKVWEFDPRNFKEDSVVDEGMRDKLKVLALIGMAGMGGNMALDAISAKNSPLGQALAVAAQQGDQEAAMHLKNLDAYIDGRDTRTLSGLRQQYLGKSAFEDQETDECGCDDGGSPAQEKPKSPLGEFILSFYDRNTGQFPKGETAVLTMVEKEYGDHYVPMATEFINRVHGTFKEFAISENPEIERIRSLAGL